MSGDSESFLAERGPAQIDKDQGELEIPGDFPERAEEGDEGDEEELAAEKPEAA